MSQIVDVPMAQQRDIRTVTTEIRTLTQQAQRMALEYAIEIGRRLTEAKSMIGHGEWAGWLKSEVEFSQSTAQNFMRLYREYGADQVGIEGAELKSQALGTLSVTKALALLALPAEDREEFIEAHDVDALSTRQLEAEIKAVVAERDELKRQAQRIAEEHAAAMAKATAATNRASAELEALRKVASDSKAAAQDAKAALAKAKAEIKAAADRADDLAANPVVDQATLDRLRAEAQEEARKAANQAASDATARAEEAERKLKLANPDIAVFNARFAALQEDFNKLCGLRLRIAATDTATGDKLARALRALIGKMGQALPSAGGASDG